MNPTEVINLRRLSRTDESSSTRKTTAERRHRIAGRAK
jgi:hypothetical protein